MSDLPTGHLLERRALAKLCHAIGLLIEGSEGLPEKHYIADELYLLSEALDQPPDAEGMSDGETSEQAHFEAFGQ